MGAAYNGLLDDRAVLQMQLQMWAAACQDDEVREVDPAAHGAAVAAAAGGSPAPTSSGSCSSWPAACCST